MNLGGATISTAGLGANAIFVSVSGSQANLSGSVSLSTTGDGAIGLYATGGGVIAATGTTTVSTTGTNSESTGFSAFGAFAEGTGSQIDLADATIITAGKGAIGLYATASTGEGGSGGGAITVSGPLSVTTGTAPFAYGAWAQGAGSMIALNGPSTFTINGGAYALYATDGGVITLAPNRSRSPSTATSGGASRSTAPARSRSTARQRSS